jgi:two-component system sensor histidine kinase KdpD
VTLERTLPLVAQTTIQVLNVPWCSMLLYDENGRLGQRAAAGTLPAPPVRNVDTFLRMGPRVLGVLRVAQRSLHEPLTAAEQERLETIATQAVLVLERARLADESGQARAMIEAERVRATLFSSVSHDLRTPLAVIKGAVTDLLDESVAWDRPARRDLLGAVNEECDRLNRLVGNLLEMSRIESGSPAPARGWHDLGELAAHVVARLRPRLAKHPTTIDLPDDLPAVHISYMQIDQVLTNLLENAAKYTPDATPIRISARATPTQIEVEIRDWGAGIAQGMLARIFEKFVRAADPERHADGSGLGLAICKGIVELHGGQIWAENMADGGARFVFTLPLGDPTPATPAPGSIVQKERA